MWAWLRLSSLFGLTCSLLWLFPVPGSACPNSQILLNQLTNMVKRDHLQSFMTTQGLDLLQSHYICKEKPNHFDTETLKKLPPVVFLQTVRMNLYQIKQELEESRFGPMIKYILGIDNNICCLLKSLPNAPADCPIPESKKTLSPTPTPGSFSWKSERCSTIKSYQSFMKNVGKVLETWGSSPEQREGNGHSPLNVLNRRRRKVRAG